MEFLHQKLDDINNQIININDRLNRIEQNLKSNMYFNIPNIQPRPTKCSKCGLELSVSMNYCCPNMDCPVGLGPMMC